MISKITKGVQPVGLFCGGSGISGGSIPPDISLVFPEGPDQDDVNFCDGFPPIYSRTTSNGIISVSVTANKLYSKGGGYGTYVFSYYNDQSSNKWKVSKDGGDPSLDITISQWGIAISGTPAVGEGFTVLLEQGSDNSKVATVTSIERANTGKKFLIGDCNLIGHLGTLQQWRRQMGGIRTFNSVFSDLVNGYPKGIVLDALVMSSDNLPRLRKVLSLKDDNTANFLLYSGGSIQKYNEVELTDPSLIDNVSWAFCDEYNPDYAVGSDIPGSTICAYYAFSNSPNITIQKITRSKTINRDSRLYVAKSQLSYISMSGGWGRIQTSVTRNGQIKPYYGYNNAYYNGMIVRAGSTITTTVECYNCKRVQVYVYTVPIRFNFERI